MWDWSIVSKIWLCLAIASILGAIIGWLLSKLFGGTKACEKCAEYEGSLRSRDAEIAKLKSTVSSTSSSANAENTKDDAEIASLKAKISSLEGDLRASGEKYARLEGQANDWKSKVATLSAAGAAGAVAGSAGSGGDSAKLQAEIDALKAKLAESENENEYLLGQVKKAESGQSIKREVPMDERDDLELINGVGPVLERMLYDMGVYFFKDVAAWDAAKIAEMDEKLPRFKGRIVREGWVESAKEEHFKKYGVRL